MATTSNTSTPSSAASPPPLAPALPRQPTLSMKPMPLAGSPAPQTQTSVTSKEWVIPPRPKPGRKPATDTPPTKRKAQNRAAQRAFRERRAARVGELEEQIKQMEENNTRDQAELKERIDTLSKQLQECRNEVLWWRRRCESLETDLQEARRASSSRQETGTVPGGCQNCSSDRCQCIDDAFNLTNVTEGPDSASKRPNSPHQMTTTKRPKTEPEIKLEPEELEIDFTHAFSSHRHSRTSVSPTALFDPCGFCQDGTPCICAEMAAEQETKPRIESNRLPPIQSLSQYTPPPSEGDLAEPLPPISSKVNNPCANGPGTCAQCLSDPRSTLFCKSLAASRSASAATGGCCGGNGSGPGCCKSPSSNSNSNTNMPPSTSQGASSSITLSCADAYTTLSRHPNFSRASEDLETWLPRLHTLPRPRDINISNRPAMEVEAASVMGVLRYFDRRFAD